MLTRIFSRFLRIFKRTVPQEKTVTLPNTEPVLIAVRPLVRRVPHALVSQTARRPGVLARSFARGQVDLLNGDLVLSTVEETLTRRLPHCSMSDKKHDAHPTDR